MQLKTNVWVIRNTSTGEYFGVHQGWVSDVSWIRFYHSEPHAKTRASQIRRSTFGFRQNGVKPEPEVVKGVLVFDPSEAQG